MIQVSATKTNALEIDFIARRTEQGSEKTFYIQVTESMLSSDVRDRELRPLKKINDSFPKLVLTRDSVNLEFTEERIEIRNLIDWLIKE